ncbi:MAG: reactive intermediate/imine deaminase [Pseudomonas sp. PGPPP4]|uniref:Rid family detoxifying hydrolase n=1 Tax=Pseudomonas TaxID=286 RepID=UPI000BDC174D|nr:MULTISPECIES: Rid family detoxifying hydrolase [Pseudomonas]MCI1009949.1 RidA family protein [Pseudomonas oryzihabitans]OYT83168.1 MAG: reactive intermediate/imine deaminase [Pseudomonas sp. PGPPP4]
MNSKAQFSPVANYEIIFTDNAPLPLGTYSQAVRVGNTVYLSAQTPVEPKSNEVLAQDFEGQLVQTLDNLKAMAEACGGSLANVVKVNAFITDIGEFPTLNRVMERYFSKPYPARTTSGASALARNTLVAIDAIMAF